MRVTMATVMSVDARITQGDKVKTTFWRSVEDGVVLKKLITNHQVLVMGRQTYATVKPKPNDQHLQVILTSQPEAYANQAVPGQLEFVALAPRQLINLLESRGYSSVLLLGGSSNIAFLQADVVDDMYLTIEPSLFGDGLSLTQKMPAAVPLKLLEITQLNRQGTLLLHYQVIRNEVATAEQ
jgi:dihydrofolate reductase